MPTNERSAWRTWLGQPPGKTPPRLHLIGIGGSGLAAIARVLLQRGFRVSGSDRQESATLAELRSLGATAFAGHAPAQVAGADLVLISSAVPADNPEVTAAQAAGVPVVKRQDFLGPLLHEQTLIAVAGTHGKTTTTGMVATILIGAGRQPGFIVGGLVRNLGVNAAAGAGQVFAIEADEYDHMFWGLHPTVAIITNAEWDHPDCYPTAALFAQAFDRFMRQVRPGGWLVACADDPGAQQLAAAYATDGGQVVHYSLTPGSLLHATEVDLLADGGSRAVVWQGAELMGTLRLQVPGMHNVRNALAALAACQCLGVAPAVALAQLAAYRGAGRRFEAKGEVNGIRVFDDYAHHPTEIRATLAAARHLAGVGRVWAFFQPHTYSRTLALWGDFCRAFGDADQVLITDIFAARETDHLGASGAGLAAAIVHPAVRYIAHLEEAANYLAQEMQPGDLLLTLGAGDGYRVGEMVLRIVTERNGTNARRSQDLSTNG